jgi:hypothetical protein
MEPFPPFAEPSTSSKLPLLKLAPGMPSPDIWELVPESASPFATTVSGKDGETLPFAKTQNEYMSRVDRVSSLLLVHTPLRRHIGNVELGKLRLIVEQNRHNAKQQTGDAIISMPSALNIHFRIHPNRHNNSAWHVVRAVLVFLGSFCILLALVFGGLYLAGGGKI